MSDIYRTFHRSTMPTAEEADDLAWQLGIDHFGGDKNFRWSYSLSPSLERFNGEVLNWEVSAHCWMDDHTSRIDDESEPS